MACKFKVGDRVRANEKSNSRYAITNQIYEFEGEIVRVSGNSIDIRQTKGYGTSVRVWSGLEDNYFDLIKSVAPSEPELHITVKGNETVGVYKHDGKTDKAIAKCSPEDTFDFATGFKLVCERLGVLPTSTEPVKPKKQALKFKTGDYAKIIAKKHGHEFKIGTIVKLEVDHNDYKAYSGCECWWVKDDELEAYTPPVEELNWKCICVKSNRRFWTVGKIYECVDSAINDDDNDPRYYRTFEKFSKTLSDHTDGGVQFIKLVE